MTPIELYVEYEKLGLVQDPYAQAIANKADPTLCIRHSNCAHWPGLKEGHDCQFAFRHHGGKLDITLCDDGGYNFLIDAGFIFAGVERAEVIKT